MKKVIFAISVLAVTAVSCSNVFELREDSTTCIQFADSLQYEGKWTFHSFGDTLEYANIEFAGFPAYYYLKDGKLYRSKREMISGKLGEKINYMN